MTKAYGITAFGGYIPRWRLDRNAIAKAHQWMAPALKGLAKGQRAFCGWDEDSVTMGVEAARDALDGQARDAISRVVFASTTHPFADLQHATIIGSALGLSSGIRTLDVGQSQRAGISALLAALSDASSGSALVVASDRPRGKPASTQEMNNGAGAAAFTLGSEKIVAELRGSASKSALFVDHFRAAESQYDYFWEERWIRDEGYLKLVPPVIAAALADAGVEPKEIRHFILPSSFKGIATAVARSAGIPAEAEADALTANCGYTGTAHGLLMLAHVLERAEPGEHILLAGFGQGCDVLVLRVTDAITNARPRRGVSGALADKLETDAYLRLLANEGGVDLDWGMRAERPVKTALTEQYRSNEQISHFQAGKCRACSTIQFPQLPFCVNPACNAPSSQFDQVALADAKARVMTFTADWLSYHPAPPLYVGFVQFDNAARLMMEIVDVGPAGLEIGAPVNMVFRIKDIDRVRHYPRYFWKAIPVQGQA
ncbi:hydroxymethylglutaryl-CoA synthase family protein [Ottowia thiooxydans]|uniref:hydroxymethylglutaryl-CoA synthase family protein n=1 Tax=Ottowia thiooxydans TaxID=219182 RepID=UPI0003FC282C|nr:3-oxoacyl-[acyl-carrier-protein] synthase III C-terminal domain-containing protein [Ottowia thiooxydans]